MLGTYNERLEVKKKLMFYEFFLCVSPPPSTEINTEWNTPFHVFKLTHKFEKFQDVAYSACTT